jgi:hypothetical protein
MNLGQLMHDINVLRTIKDALGETIKEMKPQHKIKQINTGKPYKSYND